LESFTEIWIRRSSPDQHWPLVFKLRIPPPAKIKDVDVYSSSGTAIVDDISYDSRGAEDGLPSKGVATSTSYSQMSAPVSTTLPQFSAPNGAGLSLTHITPGGSENAELETPVSASRIQRGALRLYRILHLKS